MCSPNRNQTKSLASPSKADPRLLREDHFLCRVMDAGLALSALIERRLSRRGTRRRSRCPSIDANNHATSDLPVVGAR
jgi:hypothetical protein